MCKPWKMNGAKHPTGGKNVYVNKDVARGYDPIPEPGVDDLGPRTCEVCGSDECPYASPAARTVLVPPHDDALDPEALYLLLVSTS